MPERAVRPQVDLLSALFVGLAAFVVFVATACPEVYWLDSAELVAASHTLGGVHPPGHPVYLILAKLVSLLPVGSVAIRINLLSAVFGAASLALLQLLGLRALRDESSGRDVLRAFAVAGGVLVFGLTPAVWFQSVRAEVYTLNLFFCLAPIFLLVRPAGMAVPAAVFLAGLGLGNLHLLVFLTVPALVWMLVTSPEGRSWLRPGRVLLLAGVGLISLAPYALLPLRARLLPDMAWGDPSTPEGLFDVVSARVFQSSADPAARADIWTNLSAAVELFVGQLSAVVFVGGLVGLGCLAWRRRRLGGALVLLFVGSLASKVLMYFDPSNPDAHGYFSLALAMLALGFGALVAIGVDTFITAVSRRAVRPLVHAAVGAALAALLVTGFVVQFSSHRAESDLAGFRAPSVALQASLEAIPPRALVMPYLPDLHFLLQYGLYVEERRPDVDLVHQTFNEHIDEGRPYREWLRHKVRGGSELADAWELRDVFPSESVVRMALRRPVYIEAFTALVVPPENLDGFGILTRVVPSVRPAVIANGLRHLYWKGLDERLGDWLSRDPRTRNFVTWYRHLEASLLIRQAELEGARASLERNLALNPSSRSLARLGVWLDQVAQLPSAEQQRAMRTADVESIVRAH